MRKSSLILLALALGVESYSTAPRLLGRASYDRRAFPRHIGRRNKGGCLAESKNQRSYLNERYSLPKDGAPDEGTEERNPPIDFFAEIEEMPEFEEYAEEAQVQVSADEQEGPSSPSVGGARASKRNHEAFKHEAHFKDGERAFQRRKDKRNNYVQMIRLYQESDQASKNEAFRGSVSKAQTSVDKATKPGSSEDVAKESSADRRNVEVPQGSLGRWKRDNEAEPKLNYRRLMKADEKAAEQRKETRGNYVQIINLYQESDADSKFEATKALGEKGNQTSQRREKMMAVFEDSTAGAVSGSDEIVRNQEVDISASRYEALREEGEKAVQKREEAKAMYEEAAAKAAAEFEGLVKRQEAEEAARLEALRAEGGRVFEKRAEGRARYEQARGSASYTEVEAAQRARALALEEAKALKAELGDLREFGDVLGKLQAEAAAWEAERAELEGQVRAAAAEAQAALEAAKRARAEKEALEALREESAAAALELEAESRAMREQLRPTEREASRAADKLAAKQKTLKLVWHSGSFSFVLFLDPLLL